MKIVMPLLVLVIFTQHALAQKATEGTFYLDTDNPIKESEVPKLENDDLKLNTIEDKAFKKNSEFNRKLLDREQQQYALDSILRTKLSENFDQMSLDILILELHSNSAVKAQKKYPQFDLETLNELKKYLTKTVQHD
jgi:hypothetical protein